MTDTDTCSHSETTRGNDIPRRWGSYRSEVCRACGAFRPLDHHDEVRGSWRPASEYAAATEDDDGS